MGRTLTEREGEILQFHIDPGDPESFVAGRLLAVFESSFLVQLITPAGSWDGFGLFALRDLGAIEQETPYMQKLERLARLRHAAEKAAPARQMNGIDTLLFYARQQDQPVAIELLQSGERDLVGYVDRFDESYLVIAQLDEWGRSDGISVVRRDPITRMYCADESLLCLKLLHESERE